MTRQFHIFMLAAPLCAALTLGACKTVPKPVDEVVEAKPEITIDPNVPKCTPTELLTRKVDEAVYRRGFHITSIESPPEYVYDPETGQTREIPVPPIESKVPYETLVTPERIYWVNSEGTEVLDACVPADGKAPDTYVPGE